MEHRGRGAHILLVENNEADIQLIQKAFTENKAANNFVVAGDGEAAIDYLEKIGSDVKHIRPDMIFLNTNLPKKNGLEVLEEIKSNPLLRSIPVVVISPTGAEEHMIKSYHLNANCFISKPAESDRFMEVVKLIENFWFGIAMLPSVN